MSEELQELINLLYDGNLSQYGKRKLETYIKKQEKEIHEIIKANDKLKKTKRIKTYEDECKYFVPKDKIREKIEEIHKEPMNYSPDEYWIENECRGYCIDKLKELLESEE